MLVFITGKILSYYPVPVGRPTCFLLDEAIIWTVLAEEASSSSQAQHTVLSFCPGHINNVDEAFGLAEEP